MVIIPRGIDEDEDRRIRAAQSFWTTVVGVPAIISVMRLVVEAGGELQTTLLLVANVNPVNLVAAFVTTASRLVSASMVALFAISAVLTVSVDSNSGGWSGRRRPLIVIWKRVAPSWFLIVTLLVALATWKILYLPLLLPAAAATFQLSPRRLHDHPAMRGLIIAVLLGAYAWLVVPVLREAAGQAEWVAFLAFAAPPLLALAVTGPVLPATVRPLAVFGQLAMLVLMAWTAYSVATAPVLPRTVTTIVRPVGVEQKADDDAGPADADTDAEPADAEPAGGDGGPAVKGLPDNGLDTASSAVTEDIRGSVIIVDDVSVVILQEHGGVRYVATDEVVSRVLCPSEEDLPRYRLWVRDFHVEDSLLEALGRQVRPITPVDAACRVSANAP